MVTSRLLEVFLACPVKCHLLSEGKVPDGTEYSAWATARVESYRREGVRKQTSQVAGPGITSAEPGLWKHESWQFAVGKIVWAEDWEAEVTLIQRIPQTGAPSRFVPIRFVAHNRLSASDKTMAAFEALSLAKALGTKTGTAKIVHDEKQATLSVNAAASSRAVHRKVAQVASLLSAVSPPDKVVNRHCPECGFHDRCRKDAVGKDELSLLSNLTGKERAKYRGKGICTPANGAGTSWLTSFTTSWDCASRNSPCNIASTGFSASIGCEAR